MAGFTKLQCSILHSSVWQPKRKLKGAVTIDAALLDSLETKALWTTLLAMSNSNGEVKASILGIAESAGVPIEHCERIMQEFQEPDQYSRTKMYEGRRIGIIDDGYLLLNYDLHRAEINSEERKLRAAEHCRNYRARLKAQIEQKGKASRYDSERQTPTAVDREKQNLVSASTSACASACASKDISSDVLPENKSDSNTYTTMQNGKLINSPEPVTSSSRPYVPDPELEIPNDPVPPPVEEVKPAPVQSPPAASTQPLLPGLEQKSKPGRPKKDKAEPPPKPRKDAGPFVALDPVLRWKPEVGAAAQLRPDLPKVNAWTVWMEFLEDRYYPRPIADPKDTKISAILSASFTDRAELEWVYSEFIQDDTDEWMNANCPNPCDRPLRLLSFRAARYRATVSRIPRQPDGTLHYTHGQCPKEDGSHDPTVDEADAILAKLDADADARDAAQESEPRTHATAAQVSGMADDELEA